MLAPERHRIASAAPDKHPLALHPSADTPAEVDDLTPIHPGIDVANSSTSPAAKVRTDFAPIPRWQITEAKPAVVVATFMIAGGLLLPSNGTARS